MAMPPAKGLFHRAIVQSGADVKGVSRDAATKGAEAFLAKLGLKPDQVDELQKLSTDQLLAGIPGGGFPGPGGLPLAPVVDGSTLPTDPFDPVAPAVSADVPLLIGTVESEVAFFPNQQLDPIDDASLHARIKQTVRKASDAQVDQLIAAYRKGRPSATNTDLFLIIASDATFRAGVVLEAERKAAQGRGAVYQYYWTWKSPVRDGKLRAFHTVEIPFVFDNVDGAKSMTGDGQDRYALASKVSGAWVAFARTGNPNHPDIPNWPAFDNTHRATMILDNECRAVNDPYGEEQRMLHSLQNS
jgi:para-nitrobenzyl esterase